MTILKGKKTPTENRILVINQNIAQDKKMYFLYSACKMFFSYVQISGMGFERGNFYFSHFPLECWRRILLPLKAEIIFTEVGPCRDIYINYSPPVFPLHLYIGLCLKQ